MDYSAQISQAQSALQTAKNAQAQATSAMTTLAGQSGFAAGRAQARHGAAKSAMTAGDTNTAAVHAVARNVEGQKALSARAQAEVQKQLALLWGNAASLYAQQLAALFSAQSKDRAGQPSATDAAAAKIAEDAADTLVQTAVQTNATTIKISVPATLGLSKTDAIAQQYGIQTGADPTAQPTPQVPLKAQYPFSYLGTDRQRNRMYDRLPSEFTSALQGFQGVGKGGGLGTTVTIADPTTGTTTTTTATMVDPSTIATAGACDWWCTFTGALSKVGNAAGTAAVAASGSIGAKDATAGAVLAGSGGFLASLTGGLNSAFSSALGLGQKQGAIDTGQPDFGLIGVIGLAAAGAGLLWWLHHRKAKAVTA